jgi:alpha-mannosidase/mannosylglycerate hydrolase
MENEYLAVAIDPNGTLAVTDKRTGQTYARLLTFEDVADIGDGWYHGQPVNDERFVSSAAAADVALIHDGPLLARFRIRTTLRLPAEFRFDSRTRSEELIPLTLDTQVTLRAGSDRIEVRTGIDNTIKDHRLRVLFPTGADAATRYLADGAFDVVERPIALPANNHLAREIAVETTPQQTWTAVVNPAAAPTGGSATPVSAPRGLAIISAGLMESAVRDQPGRPLALTLLRATRRTVLTDGQPAGQLPGRHVFHYWIVPQATATPDRRALCEAGQQLAAGFRAAQLCAPDLAIQRGRAQGAPGCAAPVTGSLFEVKGAVVVSSVREVAGALEVRIFNPDTAPAKVSFVFAPKFAGASVTRVDFESIPLPDVPALPGISPDVAAPVLGLALGPKEIVTLKIEKKCCL